MRDSDIRRGNQAAVIGYAARLPGADNVTEIWDTLINERCEVGAMSAERWSDIRYFDPDPSIPGKSYAYSAGLLERAFEFDAGYFGLTPREAEQMDPQQRVLLETVASAFNNAGIDPSKLDRARTGVFVGAASSDHSTTCFQDPSMIDAQYMLGNTLSIISNRISYHWDLQGPSYTVDTACSSGLYALDQARRAIELGEIDTAVVGSVNMLLSPMPFIGFSKASMLSQTGLCQAFSKNADGYVRAEGAVVFVLRNANLARTERDRIRSYVVATGTNSDGRTPGIAMPSSDRQYALLEQIKEQFDIRPNDLAFIEAHGTGTAVGDPEEARAIGKAYGQDRDTPLLVGSAKTNFGHLEPAAGLVGLLKAQLALEHGVLPASLHAEELNPDIPFDDLGLEVARSPKKLKRRAQPWLAAVNSFGFGGANSHAVLQQAEDYVAENVEMPPTLLISAESKQSLEALAKSWIGRADGDESALAHAVADANTRIERHRERLCVPAGSAETLKQSLQAWLAGENKTGFAVGNARKTPERVGFVFSGNGSQWVGMGRVILLRNATFRESFGKASAIASELGAGSLLELIMSVDLDKRLERAPVAQPLLLAVQIALVDALAEEGVRPDAVLGHSAGEVAAAYACGAISMEDAMRIIVARSVTLDQLHGDGTMAALSCDAERAEEIITAAGLAVDVAAVNSANSITVAGSTEEVAHLLKLCRKQRIAGRKLQIDYAYHSRQTDVLKSRLIDELEGIKGSATKIPFYSGCKGGQFSGKKLDQDFWWENARNRVQFNAGIEAMAKDGVTLFLEISPKSVLQSYIADTLEETGHTGTVLGSLEETNADKIDAQTIAMNVLVHGGDIDEEPLLGGFVPFRGELPEYPFSREYFRMGSDRVVDHFGRRFHHPLLGGRLHPDADVWTAELSLSRLPWLADHVVGGRVLVPATAFLEMFLSAARELLKAERVELRNFEILRPIQLQEHGSAAVRVSYDTSARRLTLESREGSDWSWVAGASVFSVEAQKPAPVALATGESSDGLYPALTAVGLDYGPAFARLEQFAPDGSSIDIKLAPTSIDVAPFQLDPTASDSILHGVFPLIEQHIEGSGSLFVPGHIGKVRFYGSATPVGARLTLKTGSLAGICIAVTIVDESGDVIAELDDLWLRPLFTSRERDDAMWDETFVPASAPQELRPFSLDAVRRAEDDAASDLEVLRDTIGSRLAWDIVAAAEDGNSMDRRYETALTALEGMELVTTDRRGRVSFNGECPWPDLPTLLNLLVEIEPQAADEVQAILHGMVNDRPNDATGITRLRQAMLDVVSNLGLNGGRVLLVGRIDPAVFAAVRKTADHVVLGVEKSGDVEAVQLLLDGAEHCLAATIDDALRLPGYDVVLGVGVAEALSPQAQTKLAEYAERGARLVLADYAADIFELMTGRYSDPDTVAFLDHQFSLRGLNVTETNWTGAAQVTIRSAHGTAKETPLSAPLEVHGDGRFAEALKAVSQGEGDAQAALVALDAQDDLMSTILAQSEAFRDLLPDASTVWIVQDGLDGEAALRGWRRALVNETGRDIRSASVAAGIAPERVLEVIANSPERELLISDAGAVAARIVPAQDEPRTAAKGEKTVLSQTAQGRMDTLHWAAKPRQKPASDEIEIAVASTALNFRDVMWAQGALPSDLLAGGFAGPTLGMECAGVVERAGRSSGFKAGDKVLAFAPDAFASHVTVTANAAVALPDALDVSVASAIPVIFVTAEYALNDLARIAEGEWCLIHGGAGGVGLAAIQIAKRAGARIIASAGSDEKRALLRTLGVEHICDSRSLTFADDVMRITEGRGVDIVLNSLAGEAMEQGIACLAPFGRFIELGKRDFAANTSIGLRALKNNISYFGVDADQLLRHRPDLVTKVMDRIVAAFTSGDYSIPPVRLFPPEMVTDAFKFMQNSRHVGKILVAPPAPGPNKPIAASDLGGSWLIAGGTKGFGLATAGFLADQGANVLWLVSRSGTIDDTEALAALEAKGITVNVRATDLTNEEATAALMKEIETSGAGLDGVVAGAAVFDDAMFAESDTGRLAGVIVPKLASALLLDKLTRSFDINHFWLYSSVSARFGNPGQSAYVAANMELEAIARRRAAEGLPGLAIAWGPIANAGYLTETEALKSAIERKLGKVQTTQEAFEALASALDHAPHQSTLTIAPVQWARLKGDLPVVSEPLFEYLDIQASAEEKDGTIDLAGMLASGGAAKARKFVTGLLKREIAQIMRVAPAEIDPNRELIDMGLDSLMGMNLKMAIEERLGMATPMNSIGDGMTLNRLAHLIVAAAASGEAADETETMAQKHLKDADLPDDIKEKISNAATR